MKQFFSLLAIAPLLIFSCKKEDHSHDITKENLSGTYRFTAAVRQVGNTAPEDVFINRSECEKDDMIRLNTNNTYNYIDAGIRCSPPADGAGTWSLLSTIKMKMDFFTFDIKSFDGKKLVINLGDTINSSINNYTLTYVKQ